MRTVQVRTEGQYFNHSVKQNKAVDITFKMPYTELTNYIRSIQMLNENVTLGAKIGADKKVQTLGTFMIHNVRVDGDGEGTIRFNSQLDFVNLKIINELALRNEEPLQVFLKAQIDISGLEDEESEPENNKND